jgi:hypothetical protein
VPAGPELLAGKENVSLGGRDFLAGKQNRSPGDVGCLPARKTCPPGMLAACRQGRSTRLSGTSCTSRSVTLQRLALGHADAHFATARRTPSAGGEPPAQAPTTPRARWAQCAHASLHLCFVLACSAHEAAPRAYLPRDPTRTALYRLVADQRATFTQVTAEQGHVPSFVNESCERFLRCGVLAYGFARGPVHDDDLVPLSR